MHQSINQINQLVTNNQQNDQSINQPTNQSIILSNKLQTNQLTNQQQTIHPTNQIETNQIRSESVAGEM